MKRFAVIVALLAIAVAGCGGGSSSDGGQSEGSAGSSSGTEAASGGASEAAGGSGGATLNFVAQGIAYTEAPTEAAAGPTTFALDNQDSVEHYVVIDEVGLEVEAEGGEQAQGTADLEPGTYTYYCKVPGHREAGMEGTLTVS